MSAEGQRVCSQVVKPPPLNSPIPPFSDSISHLTFQMTYSTLTNNFEILNAGSVSVSILRNHSSTPAIQLLSAYNALAKERLAAFNFNGKPVKYGNAKLGTISVTNCPSLSDPGSVCHAVAATIQLNYTTADFSTKPYPAAVTAIQDAINANALDCKLRSLYPATVLTVTTGGSCPGAYKAGYYDSWAWITNTFSVSTSTSVATIGTVQKTELANAYGTLIKNALTAPFFTKGAKTQINATIDSISRRSSCSSGRICYSVTGFYQFKYYSENIPTSGVSGQALQLVNTAINAGKLICAHKLLSPNSVVKITTGTACPAGLRG